MAESLEGGPVIISIPPPNFITARGASHLERPAQLIIHELLAEIDRQRTENHPNERTSSTERI